MKEDEAACVLFDSGHRACAGCAAAMVARLILDAAGKDTIVVSATGCMEVFSTPYPRQPGKSPGSTPFSRITPRWASGVVASLKKQGEEREGDCPWW